MRDNDKRGEAPRTPHRNSTTEIIYHRDEGSPRAPKEEFPSSGVWGFPTSVVDYLCGEKLKGASRLITGFLLLSSTLFANPGYFEPWGCNSDLKPQCKAALHSEEKLSLATRVADAVIQFHQKVISPVDGPRSSYRPSSSQYMHQAMHRYGFLKGFVMGCDRLLRENDEEWVYRTIQFDGKIFKYDPANLNKYE